MRFLRLVAISFLSFIGASLASALPVNLRCELLENPLGIDSTSPRLSWQSIAATPNWMQSAYEILVATQPGLLKPGSADIWDSGKIQSAESVGIVYGGPAVQSRHRYYWTVRVWDAQSQQSEFAAPAWWKWGYSHPAIGAQSGSTGQTRKFPMITKE